MEDFPRITPRQLSGRDAWDWTWGLNAKHVPDHKANTLPFISILLTDAFRLVSSLEYYRLTGTVPDFGKGEHLALQLAGRETNGLRFLDNIYNNKKKIKCHIYKSFGFLKIRPSTTETKQIEKQSRKRSFGGIRYLSPHQLRTAMSYSTK